MGRAEGFTSRARRIAFAAALAAALLMLTAVPAGASTSPPGWQGSGDGVWVAFTFSNTSPAPDGRTGSYQPITLERSGSLSGQALIDAFSNWDTQDTNNDGTPDAFGWPSVWQAGGITLERVDAWCDAWQSSCSYKVTGGAGNQVFFFAGSVPLDSNGQPVFDLNQYDQGALSLASPPQLLPFIGANVVTTPAVDTTPGSITLDGSGSSDEAGGALTHEWTVVRQADGHQFTGSGQTFTFSTDQAGSYCATLKVTSDFDGASQTSGQYCFAVSDTVVPKQPGPTPAPAPAPSGGGGGVPSGGGGGVPSGGGGGGIPGVFTRPVSRAPAALTGAPGAAYPTVVWLWRPEWFQSTTDDALPRTDGQPEVKGKTAVVVSNAPAPNDTNAGPWLAGLGAFGLIGGGFLINRWRLRYRPSF